MSDRVATADRDPLIGEIVGDFRVERQLGSGGMGAVYMMRHRTHPNTRKVLKVMLKEHANNAFMRARFEAEADALSQLGDHPCIVGMDDFTTLPDGQLAIVMKFCEGMPLENYVLTHGGKLSPHRTFYAASHIARGLHYAHARSVVHRDLKPANVFVEDDDNDLMRCRLLDFGVARRINPNPAMPSTTMAGPLGTPDFMAPEQQDRAAEATAAADVFSLAVMLWWMVTGGLPWGQQSDPAILYVRKLNTPPDPPLVATFPAGWEDLLRAALRPDPAARPSLRQLMQGLAMALPSVGRHVLSGPDILQRHCRPLFDESYPDDVTLRNNSARTLVPAWPEREPAARPAVSTPSPSGPSTMTGGPSRDPTHNERAPGMVATTLAGSSGVVMASSGAPTPRAWKLAALGVGLALATGAATFAIATTRSGRSSVEAAPASQPLPASAAPASAAPASAIPASATPAPASATPAPATPAPATPAPATAPSGPATPPSRPATLAPATPAPATPAPATPATARNAASVPTKPPRLSTEPATSAPTKPATVSPTRPPPGPSRGDASIAKRRGSVPTTAPTSASGSRASAPPENEPAKPRKLDPDAVIGQ